MKKGTKFLIAILILIIVGLVGYIIADKLILNKTDKNEVKNNTINEVQENTANEVQSNTTTDESVKNKDKEENDRSSRDIKLTSEEKILKKLEVGNAKYICREHIPTISGIDSKVAEKIQNKLREDNKKIWDGIEEDEPEYEINELLTSMAESNNDIEIGFYQKYEIWYKNDNVVTFRHIFDGGLGGVSWWASYGISFDLSSGEEIKIENIVTNKEKYIEACKKSVYQQLKNDEKNAYLQDGYQEILDYNIEQTSGWFTEEGIACVCIPKYAMAAGAAGEFQYVVPYEDIKDYIKAEYVF
ncbi:MAG: DUF3298 domain-containing protein [Clostridia bacterium]|nr:DUF3298 domain-containing protein [Clostridia bacterium]